MLSSALLTSFWLIISFCEIAVVLAAGGPQDGDIRLADGTATKGRLEVYLDGDWGTVCYDPKYYTVWENGAARAACRQLGFSDQINVGSVVDLGIPEASSNTPIKLSDLNCPYTRDADLNNVAQHVMRCTHSKSTPCNHTGDMAIECTNTSKYNSSYDTEVRLVEGETGFPSSGIVEVYLNKEWGTVCYDSFQDQHVADTVCRQMGYTSASSFSSVADITLRGVPSWVKSIDCSGTSHPCFVSCFNYLATTSNSSCNNGRIAAVTCTF